MRLTTTLLIIQVAALGPTAGFVVMSYLHHGKIEWALGYQLRGPDHFPVSAIHARKDGW